MLLMLVLRFGAKGLGADAADAAPFAVWGKRARG